MQRPRGSLGSRLLSICVVVVTAILACNGSSGRSGAAPGPETEIVFPTGGTFSGSVKVKYILRDAQANLADIAVAYSIDGGNVFLPATEDPTPPHEGISGLAVAPPPGISHFYHWETTADLGYVLLPSVQVRIIAADPVPGVPGVSAPFSVDNQGLKPPEVIDVSDSVYNTVNNEVVIRFDRSLDPSTVIHQGGSSDTMAVFRDQNTVPGGNFSQETGAISLSDGDRVIHYSPSTPFIRYREIRIALTSGITSNQSTPLEAGAAYPSAPLTFQTSFPDQVFEIRFIPGIGPNTATFREDPGTDIWFIDFDTFDTIDGDLFARGLRGFDPLVGDYSRDRVVAQILSTSSEKYQRDPANGTPISGAYNISFSAVRPSGVLGTHYNRICLGLNMGGLWGVAWYDPGNNFIDDDCSRSIPLGVFTGGIYGLDSVLAPRLGAGDVPYVDGSYLLGTDPAMDNRFLRVRAVIWDWGHALGVITAHEIGHSVGLPHDDSNNLNIMRSWASSDHVSNPAVRFSPANHGRLRSNLGQVP